jgi:hypothetical protein
MDMRTAELIVPVIMNERLDQAIRRLAAAGATRRRLVGKGNRQRHFATDFGWR